MSVDYAGLEPGQTISHRTYTLDEETVALYVSAVEDRSGPIRERGGHAVAPPMAVAALSLRGVINDLQIPGGTLHAGQELEFSTAVPVGEVLDCSAVLAQNSVRGEWRFLVVDMAVEDSEGRRVMNGKGTIMVPTGS